MLDIDNLILNKMSDVKMIMQVHDELVFECPKNNADKSAVDGKKNSPS